MFSSRHPFRGQSVQTLCGRTSVPHCDQHRWAAAVGVPRPFDYQTPCMDNSGDTSSNCSSLGLRRQELRSRGNSRSLYLSQSRSGPGVRIHFVDDGKLQFLSECCEISSFVASDKGVVFFDNVDMQRGEAQITYKSRDLYQLASLSLPTHVAELVTDLSNLAPQVFHDAATTLFARLPHQHRRSMSGKGSGGSCLNRHGAQCAGADTELYIGSVSAHFDLIS